MDKLGQALSLYRRRKFDDCIKACTEHLSDHPYDQAVWVLKMKAMTRLVYVDEVEVDEESIADVLMDENAMATVSRPGTSLKRAETSARTGTSQGIRPTTNSGRPITGFARPGTQSSKPTSLEQALRTPRTAQTARPATSSSGRFVRLGTASMLAQPDGPFVDVARLNLNKYAVVPYLAKPLFTYLFHHENNVRSALQLASLATESCKFNDWWWKVQLAKCYYRLNMFRDAEQQLKSAVKQQPHIDTFLYLGKVYQRLDQPLAAVDNYKAGLERFPKDPSLLTAIARVYEGLNDLDEAVKVYEEVLKVDNVNFEALACIATHYFYADQPELALKFFRRLLQMGVYNAELFCNVGLCCFAAQQYDMTLTCFERALALATDEIVPEIWYNVGYLALSVGDLNLAHQCFRLTLSLNSEHAEAYNNLGVLEQRKGNSEAARAFFQAAGVSGIYEPLYNLACLNERAGDLQDSFSAVRKALDAYPGHIESKNLMQQIRKQIELI